MGIVIARGEMTSMHLHIPLHLHERDRYGHQQKFQSPGCRFDLETEKVFPRPESLALIVYFGPKTNFEQTYLLSWDLFE